MSVLLVIAEAIGAALSAALSDFQQNSDAEKAIIAAEESLALSRAKMKFGTTP